MQYNKNEKTDQILDLLLDALLERQHARAEGEPIQPEPTQQSFAAPLIEEVEEETAVFPPSTDEIREATDGELDEPDEVEIISTSLLEDSEAQESAYYIPEKLPSIHLDNMLKKLVVFLTLLIILINIPFNRYGTNLARAMPDTQSLVIRNGLVLKGSDEKIYVLEENKKRWITTLDAFTQYGYRWQQVHEVDDAFLDQFENGRPIYLLQKCDQSPHVYAIEDGKKRWIKNITALQAAGFIWEDVRFTSCQHLRNIPDGIPIPPDAGDPPQP